MENSLRGFKGASNNVVVNEDLADVIKKEGYSSFNDMVHNDVVHNDNKVPKDIKQSFPKSYTPPWPFPQGVGKAKLDWQSGKFLEVIKEIYNNILFTQCLVSNIFAKNF